MIALLNLGSLILGLIAWALPVINLARYEKSNNRYWVFLSIMSISACAISLCFQIYSTYDRVKSEDWSALMDTMEATATVSAILLIFTILLNAVTLVLYRKRLTK
ncbi:hypothetical protein CWR48_11510 [Oceanobacillus arenosus]|uniref:Cytochrome c oxidase subunit 4 n=1 Tax=Oceanobacillus arenosus TaxID=1229153 RepID=A0A3D8PRJ6_9BACI|nr:hypothetical protein [Oceanobacillus arenosus]RDW18207.1 hypothetical protein CWR48_11510 [Oceanobacillus arenosus]